MTIVAPQPVAHLGKRCQMTPSSHCRRVHAHIRRLDARPPPVPGNQQVRRPPGVPLRSHAVARDHVERWDAGYGTSIPSRRAADSRIASSSAPTMGKNRRRCGGTFHPARTNPPWSALARSTSAPRGRPSSLRRWPEPTSGGRHGRRWRGGEEPGTIDQKSIKVRDPMNPADPPASPSRPDPTGDSSNSPAGPGGQWRAPHRRPTRRRTGP